MIDRMIGFGANFDWITPLWTWFQDWRYRPSVGFSLPVDCGMSAYAVRDLLTARGIKVWGLTICRARILFRVRKAQSRYARYLLEKAGLL